VNNIIGISVGALSMLVPVYQSEIATKEIRGRLVSLQQWAITIGIAISFWINYSKSFETSLLIFFMNYFRYRYSFFG
jgi:MFS family permease